MVAITSNYLSVQRCKIYRTNLDPRIQYIVNCFLINADVAYSERIVSQGQQYCCLIEAKVKKGCYTQHSSTAFQQQQQGSSEPVNIEYRVAEDSEVKIYRIAKEEYLKICSIMFVSVKLLESGNYEEIVNLINHTTII